MYGRPSILLKTTILLSGLLLLLALPAGLRAAGEEPENGAGKKKSSPVVITSDTLNYSEQRAVFEGSVTARNDEMTLRAERMVVNYAENGEMETIEATGSVKLLREGQVVTSNRGVYDARERTIVMTGEPVAVEGNNVIRGSRMIYYLEEDRSVVENSKVFLKGTGGQPEPPR